MEFSPQRWPSLGTGNAHWQLSIGGIAHCRPRGSPDEPPFGACTLKSKVEIGGIEMRAAVFGSRSTTPGKWVSIEDLPRPQVQPGDVLLKVHSCGVCRTDLHIVEGDLPPIQPRIIPGHQIVGQVAEGAIPDLPNGTRVGVSWMGGVDGVCWFCRHNMENLCDHPVFTGYTVNGGYAEYVSVRADFTIPLPAGLDDSHVAPLLCEGIIAFRSLRVAGVERGERVGLFGFGSSASLAIRILQSWDCEVYVVTRGETHRKAAQSPLTV